MIQLTSNIQNKNKYPKHQDLLPTRKRKDSWNLPTKVSGLIPLAWGYGYSLANPSNSPYGYAKPSMS